MEKLNNFISWLKTLPVWMRAIVLVAVSAIALIASMSLSACGPVIKATMKQIFPESTTTITISNSSNTDVNTTANPNLSVNQ